MIRLTQGGIAAADYIAFIDSCFAKGAGETFDCLLPKLFGKGRHPENDTLFLLEEDKPAACVGCFPLTFSIGGQSFRVTGIGNVATRPDCRGKGYMQTLMKKAIQTMAEDGTDFAVLGGRRHRYNHFGFEKCDAMIYFSLTEKTVTDADPRLFADAGQGEAFVMRRLDLKDSALLDRLHTAMHARPYHTLRPRKDLFDILSSWRSIPYVFMKGDRLAGWAIYYKDKRQLSEFHSLDASDTPFLLRLAVRTLGDLTVALPPHRPAFFPAADALAEHAMLVSNECFLVFRWEKLLSSLLLLKASYAPMADGVFSFTIRDLPARPQESESYTLSVRGGRPSMTKNDAPCGTVFSFLVAHRVFFSHYAPERLSLPPFLASVLPLPLTIDEADNV